MAFDHQRQVKWDAGTRTSDWSTRIETKLFVYVHLCTDGDALPRLAADSSHPPTTAPSQIYKVKFNFWGFYIITTWLELSDSDRWTTLDQSGSLFSKFWVRPRAKQTKIFFRLFCRPNTSLVWANLEALLIVENLGHPELWGHKNWIKSKMASPASSFDGIRTSNFELELLTFVTC